MFYDGIGSNVSGFVWSAGTAFGRFMALMPTKKEYLQQHLRDSGCGFQRDGLCVGRWMLGSRPLVFQAHWRALGDGICGLPPFTMLL
jgi:hypothetical protein